MLVSVVYLLLAIIGLGLLIFIHELGHYWMARRVGMRVESFGIGFGHPIYSFEHNGVRWNICWIPFGGYVKIAGMEKEQGVAPEAIPDGFFGKSPWARIQVAVMGPFANIALAFVLFCLLWIFGGREKDFSEVNNFVGWVDPHSALYQSGVRPGDIILSYGREIVRGPKDHFYAAMTAGGPILTKGLEWDPVKQQDAAEGKYVPFTLDIRPYPHPQAFERGILTTGVLSSGAFLIYDTLPGGRSNPLPKGSPLEGSGIQYGDRIVWVDGELVRSLPQLSHVLNDGRVLATVKRGSQHFLRRLPRLPVEELKLDSQQKEELADWQWEAGLKKQKLGKLFFVPYNLTSECVVESRLPCVDADAEEHAFPKQPLSDMESPLETGDVIVAIDGASVQSASELFAWLQAHRVLVIVQQHMKADVPMSLARASAEFEDIPYRADLLDITRTIGYGPLVSQKGALRLLRPIEPKTRAELFQAEGESSLLTAELEEEKRRIQAIEDPEKRAQALKYVEKRNTQLLLGLPDVQGQLVRYNPTPFQMFNDVAEEVARTLSALVGGYLNPKWISGPIGIVQVIHTQWMMGFREALFWMATISLNLGLLNLLPLPVLDGGYICLSLFEVVTGRRIQAKTMEKIIIPFAVALILFLVYLTYHDLLRILTNFVR